MAAQPLMHSSAAQKGWRSTLHRIPFGFLTPLIVRSAASTRPLVSSRPFSATAPAALRYVFHKGLHWTPAGTYTFLRLETALSLKFRYPLGLRSPRREMGGRDLVGMAVLPFQLCCMLLKTSSLTLQGTS